MSANFILSMSDIETLERQIDQLSDYKPIAEHEVKQLCDKVSLMIGFRGRFFYPERKFSVLTIRVGKRDPDGGVKRIACKVPSDDLR